jgi:hypothetical protein
MMEMYYPSAAWLCLERGTFEQLYDYKVRNGLPTFEKAIAQALAAAAPVAEDAEPEEVEA